MNNEAMLATLPEPTAIEPCRMDNPLAPWELTTDFNLDNLPKTLREEIESLNKSTAYYLSQLYGIADAKRKWVDKVVAWMTESTAYGPEHFKNDPKWERMWPAIVLNDEPLVGDNPLATAQERDTFEQRVLITSLLKDTITRDKRKKLEERAASLLCSRNPKDEQFFSEETLQECLEAEGLTTKEAVNKVLDRNPSAYIKASNYREALWAKWQERDEKCIQVHRFESGEWGTSEQAVMTAFTIGAMSRAIDEVWGREWNPGISATRQLRSALWQWWQEAEEKGDLSNYLLDPRENDDWIGIRDFTRALKAQDHDAWHYDCQEENYTAQRWLKEEGLAKLYAASEEWWADLPDLNEEETERVLNKGNDTFKHEYRESEFYDLVKGKYDRKLTEVLTHA